MPTLNQLLSGLSDEELEGLKQEFIKANQGTGEIGSAEGRGVLRATAPQRFGRAALAGIRAGGESIVSDVREMAGFSPLAKESMPMIKETKVKESRPFALQDKLTIPQGYEITGYDQKGNPMIRKIEINVAEEKLTIEQEEKKKIQEEKSELIRESALDTLNTIEEVEKGIEYFGIGGVIPAIPTLQAEKTKWQANVNKLLSGKIINLMTSMKEASKTGATGFGQLSNKELVVLKEASTALKKTLSPEDAQAILNDMKAKVNKIAQQKAAAPQVSDEREQAKQILFKKGYSEQEAEQKLGQ